MRVITGKFKGRILKMPKGAKIRPTSQKVKEALFCILGEKICAASFLELFAGSGSVGIEAKSRGAKEVFLVENNRLCIEAIKRNLRHLKILYNYGLKHRKTNKKAVVTLLPLDAERAIEILYQRGKKFDFVFLDPPYYQDKPRSPAAQGRDKLKNSLIKLCLYDILNACSYVIAEHNKSQILPHLLPKVRLMFTKRYGDTALSFYQKEVKK